MRKSLLIATNILALGSILSGCMSHEKYARQALLNVNGSSSLGSLPGVSSQSRLFAGPSTYLGPIPTGVVLLTEKATDKNLAFCKAYSETTYGARRLGEFTLTQSAWPTYWLIRDEFVLGDPLQDCEQAISSKVYDYARAANIIASLIDPDTGKPYSGDGPYIIQIRNDLTIAVVDASLANTSEMKTLANAWYYDLPNAGGASDDDDSDTAKGETKNPAAKTGSKPVAADPDVTKKPKDDAKAGEKTNEPSCATSGSRDCLIGFADQTLKLIGRVPGVKASITSLNEGCKDLWGLIPAGAKKPAEADKADKPTKKDAAT